MKKTTDSLHAIAVASDHAGYELKEFLAGYLAARGFELLDLGTHSPESVDYPDFAHALARTLAEGDAPRGIGICGSGEGMAITLNRHAGIRAGLAWCPEIARLVRQHNDANVLVLPARFIDNDQALDILRIFLETEFEGGRHQNRVAKIELP